MSILFLVASSFIKFCLSFDLNPFTFMLTIFKSIMMCLYQSKMTLRPGDPVSEIAKRSKVEVAK